MWSSVVSYGHMKPKIGFGVITTSALYNFST